RAGVTTGARLRLKRPIRVKHPLTRRWVDDWLPIGGADVTFAGSRLSMAVLDDDLLTEVHTGDLAEIYVEGETPEPPAPPPVPDRVPARDDADTEPLPEVDADTAAVLAVWTRVQGSTLDARIAAW